MATDAYTDTHISKAEINLKGTYVPVDSIRIGEQDIIMWGGPVGMASIREEWYEDVKEPNVITKVLKTVNSKPDLFTFIQRPPDIRPRYHYYMEYEENAILPIRSFDCWWHKQIIGETRNRIRKAHQKGVITKVVDFNDEFVQGITNIFNETPLRQGRLFWHYGKSFEIIRKDMGRDLGRSEFIGAYFGGELIGFMKLLYADYVADPVQFISMIRDRDKSPNNALMARAVEICEKRKMAYMVFGEWRRGTYSTFLAGNGFEKVSLPRYYVPITAKGQIILTLRLHRGTRGLLPERAKRAMIHLRGKWYRWRYQRSS